MRSPRPGTPSRRIDPRRARLLFSVAAVVSLGVTVVFTFVGDGVDIPHATGLQGAIVDLGHTVVWALLTLAFGAAAARGRWARGSNAVAVAAGILYLVFLVAVFLGTAA